MNPPIPTRDSVGEVIGIQYLRGICALFVVIDHTAAMASFTKYFGQSLLNDFFHTGSLGVPLFFSISGFIICIISVRPPDLTSRLGIGEFAMRRFVRIVPLLWVAVISYALLRSMGRTVDMDYASYFRALLPIIPGNVTPGNVWTLRYEFIFYIIFALTFLAGKTRLYLLGIWFASPLVYFWLKQPLANGTMIEQWIFMLTNPVNLQFFAGFVIGLFYIKADGLGARFGLRMPLFLKMTTERSGETHIHGHVELKVPIDAFIFLNLVFLTYMAIGYVFGINLDGVGNALLSSIICLGILWLGVHIMPSTGIFHRIGMIMGNASFAIYLFHPHFVSALLGIWSKFAKNTPVGLAVGAIALIAIIAGILIHLYLERPLIRLVHNGLKRLRQPD